MRVRGLLSCGFEESCEIRELSREEGPRSEMTSENPKLVNIL